jgi:hypothetical protein
VEANACTFNSCRVQEVSDAPLARVQIVVALPQNRSPLRSGARTVLARPIAGSFGIAAERWRRVERRGCRYLILSKMSCLMSRAVGSSRTISRRAIRSDLDGAARAGDSMHSPVHHRMTALEIDLRMERLIALPSFWATQKIRPPAFIEVRRIAPAPLLRTHALSEPRVIVRFFLEEDMETGAARSSDCSRTSGCGQRFCCRCCCR